MNDHTWGISGPQFLVLYAVLVVVAAGAIVLARRRLVGAGAGDRPPSDDLGIYEIAMLNGGAQLAITTAVAALHRRGALITGSGKSITALGRPEDRLGELEQDVYDAAERSPGSTVRALSRTLEYSPAITRMAAELRDAGMLLHDAAVKRARGLWLWLLPVIGLGCARLVAGVQGDNPVEILLFALAASAFVAWRFARAGTFATARGTALLDAKRGGRKRLGAVPHERDIAMAVALFGVSALWIADPALASAWGVPRESGWGNGGGDGGGSCGAGGGCGGGCGG